MTGPDEPRGRDELVEPLFAGLSGADRPVEDPAAPLAPGELASEPPVQRDAWHRAARARLVPADPLAAEGEPSTLRLAIQALLLIAVLVAAGAFIYLAFGV